ncbi:MAG: dTDP-4-dehydrorhamnose 3,5-epimerase [Elusimicrobia bacterium RIFOXYA12_FULL_51_18]|nr:MAG: dTDP-4-dehydrorhamnose 3,5-epimerase [Elusimicrobia bacterium RIFOXYA12_FULL_51_18]OGS32897.1 MAG: dTDP-4-dehydrorhamnose 3,5-epimerase [Elusimicrobia bacterium RIFOXYA2_FULL_53_38]
MPFDFERLEPEGLILVSPKVFKDGRGFFLESYKRSDFEKAGIFGDFVQDNHSRSDKDVLRGLHFQKKEDAQGKLIRCTSGRILDVAADIRKDSPSFGKWAALELNGTNARMLYIPPGFAHGFLVLSASAEIIYKCTREYAPGAEAGIMWNDPQLNISWPVKNPLLSEKDKVNPLLKDAAL